MEKALGGTVRQKVTLQKGIPTDKAREIVKVIKGTKIKVQAAIQGDQVRVSGKNKDDLQSVMQLLKETDLGHRHAVHQLQVELLATLDPVGGRRGVAGLKEIVPARRGRPRQGRGALRGSSVRSDVRLVGEIGALHPRGRRQAHPARAAAAGLPAVRLPRRAGDPAGARSWSSSTPPPCSTTTSSTRPPSAAAAAA